MVPVTHHTYTNVRLTINLLVSPLPFSVTKDLWIQIRDVGDGDGSGYTDLDYRR